MVNIINGIDGWKFLDMSMTPIADAFDYLKSHPEKTSLFLDSAKCEPNILEKIADNENFPLVKAVSLLNYWDDISKLEKCNQINTLSIGYEKSKFDFSSLSELTSIGGVWSKKWSNLECCKKLSEFSVSMFDQRLTEIPNIAKLKNISLIQPKADSLKGIELATELVSLRILRAAKLVDIAQIKNLRNNLVNVDFDKCKNINSYLDLSDFSKIEKLIIADCKNIDSIRFISTLKTLEVFSIYGTVVRDGNLFPCLELPNLRDFRSENVKSYHPSVEEIQRQIAN